MKKLLKLIKDMEFEDTPYILEVGFEKVNQEDPTNHLHYNISKLLPGAQFFAADEDIAVYGSIQGILKVEHFLPFSGLDSFIIGNVSDTVRALDLHTEIAFDVIIVSEQLEDWAWQHIESIIKYGGTVAVLDGIVNSLSSVTKKVGKYFIFERNK